MENKGVGNQYSLLQKCYLLKQCCTIQDLVATSLQHRFHLGHFRRSKLQRGWGWKLPQLILPTYIRPKAYNSPYKKMNIPKSLHAGWSSSLTTTLIFGVWEFDVGVDGVLPLLSKHLFCSSISVLIISIPPTLHLPPIIMACKASFKLGSLLKRALTMPCVLFHIIPTSHL